MRLNLFKAFPGKRKNNPVSIKERVTPAIANGPLYDAFISYSHAVDGLLAPAVQDGLHRFGKPFFAKRALWVFRDEVSLSANPGLWSSIEKALANSRFFILMASPDAAQSLWVDREVEFWCRNKPASNILIALTDGQIVWDPDALEFDWDETTALPPSLRGVFLDEPRYVDLRWARNKDHLSLSYPSFKNCIADLGATLHNRPKDELIGADISRHRKTLSAVIGVAIGLLMLSISIGIVAKIAVDQRNLALARSFLARAELNRSDLGSRIEDTALLAAHSLNTAPSASGANIMQEVIGLLPPILGKIVHRDSLTAQGVDPTGRLLASGTDAGELTLTTLPDVTLVSTIMLNTRPKEQNKQNAIVSHLPPLSWSQGSVYAIEFSPNGDRLAVSLLGNRRRARHGPDANNGPLFLLNPVLGKLIVQLTERDDITRILFSPDGKIVLAVTLDGPIKRWRTQDGKPLPPINHEDVLLDVAFDHSGTRIATASIDGTVSVWSWPGGRKIQSWRFPDAVRCVSFSPAADLLAAGIGRFEGIAEIVVGDTLERRYLRSEHHDDPLLRPYAVHVLSIADGRTISRLEHKAYIQSMAFSEGGRYLATTTIEGSARVWDLNEEKVVFSSSEGGELQKLLFGPALKFTIECFGDGSIRIQPLIGRGRMHMLLPPLHTRWASEIVTVTPTGARILALTQNGNAHLWDTSMGTELARFRADGPKELLTYIEPGGVRKRALFISGGGKETIVGGATHHLLYEEITVKGGLHAVKVSSPGRLAALSWHDSVLIHDATGRSSQVLEPSQGIDAIALSLKGNRLAVASNMMQKANRDEARRQTHSLRAETLANPHLQILPEEAQEGRTRIEVYDAGRLERPLQSIRHDRPVTDLIFLTENRYLAAGGPGGVFMWKLDGRSEPVHLLERLHAYSLATDSAGRWLVVKASKLSISEESPTNPVNQEDWTVVFDTTSWDERLRIASAADIISVAVSSDGRTVATGLQGGDLAIIRISNGDIVHRFGHTYIIDHIAFSHGDRFLIAAGRNGEIKVWGAHSGIAQFSAQHNARPLAVRHDPTEDAVFAYFDDGVVRHWILKWSSLVAELCNLVDSPLPEELWRAVVPNKPPVDLCARE